MRYVERVEKENVTQDCPTSGNIYGTRAYNINIFYDNNTRSCYVCQRNIGGLITLHCKTCVNSGENNCDANGCPEGSSYNSRTETCEPCQLNIGDHTGINCLSCVINGKNRCDSEACPLYLTIYNKDSKECVLTQPTPCKNEICDMISKNVW